MLLVVLIAARMAIGCWQRLSSNNNFYFERAPQGLTFFATSFISKSLSVKLFPGRNEIYAPRENGVGGVAMSLENFPTH